MIKLSAKQIAKIQSDLGEFKSKTPVVIYRALNRASQTIKTTSSREVRNTYVIKAKEVNETFKVKKANRSRLGIDVMSSGKRIPLDRFKFSPNMPKPSKPPKSIKVKVKKGGRAELLHSFVTNLHGNKLFERVGRRRLPVRRLMTISIPEMVGTKSITKEVNNRALESFYKRVEHEISRIKGGN